MAAVDPTEPGGARRAGPGGPFEIPLVVLDEVLKAVPRLVDRTRSQVELARTVAGHLPCVRSLLTARAGVSVPEHEAPQPVDVLTVVADTGAEQEPGASTEVGAGSTNGTNGTNGSSAEDLGASTGPEADSPDEDDLAVPDYDSLAASQVVPRLTTLSPDELDAVRRYELAHRRRQTILNKVAQLLES